MFRNLVRISIPWETVSDGPTMARTPRPIWVLMSKTDARILGGHKDMDQRESYNDWKTITLVLTIPTSGNSVHLV
jgi:hypothetical protein